MTKASGDDALAFVLGRLAASKAPAFQPVAGASDIHLAVRGQDGQYVELTYLTGRPETPRAFEAPPFRRRPNLILPCVVINDGRPSEAWIIPSGVFERFSSGLANGHRQLDLDSDEDGPLHERLNVYRERWALITTFSKYRSTLEDPIALKVRLAMG